MEEGYVVIQVVSNGLQAVVKGVTVYNTKDEAILEEKFLPDKDMFIVKVPEALLKRVRKQKE